MTSAIAGNGTFSFAVSGGSSDVVDYSSSEGTNPPQLVVVTQSSLVAKRDETASGNLTALHANHPNPFQTETTIRYSLPRTAPVRLVVYDVTGRVVRELVNGIQDAGDRRATWDGRDEAGSPVRSGVYVVRLEAGSTRLTRRMSLLK